MTIHHIGCLDDRQLLTLKLVRKNVLNEYTGAYLAWVLWVLYFENSAIKGQLISKGLFCVFNSSKKRTKNFCPSRLGQKFKFSRMFFGRIEDTKKTFGNWKWPLNSTRNFGTIYYCQHILAPVTWRIYYILRSTWGVI